MAPTDKVDVEHGGYIPPLTLRSWGLHLAKFDELLRAAENTRVCIADLPGFTQPTQRRTQQKTDLMVASTAFLLQRHPFSEISVQDIADGAGCSVTSIYARFYDKNALLPAVHLIILERYRGLISSKLTSKGDFGGDIQEFSKEFISLNAEFFEDNKNFFRASVVNDMSYIYLKTDQMIDVYASDMNMVVSDLLDRPPADVLHSLTFAVRVVVSIYRDVVIGGLTSKSNEKAALARLFAMILCNSLRAN